CSPRPPSITGPVQRAGARQATIYASAASRRTITSKICTKPGYPKAMPENLSQRLARVVQKMRGEARLTTANTQEMLRGIRVALLEADVALPVVRDFIGRVRERALGQDVLGSLTPGQALVGVVHRELTQLMGGQSAELDLASQPPAVVLMAGLQGAGKT